MRRIAVHQTGDAVSNTKVYNITLGGIWLDLMLTQY